MVVRTWIGNKFIGFGRSLGRADGRELAVELSGHSIRASMMDPDNDSVAWDPDMYKHGNVFVQGYANPIKPVVHRRDQLDQPDTIDVLEAAENTAQDVAAGDGDEEAEAGYTKLISSKRYSLAIKQHLIEQLIRPQQYWQKLLIGIVAVAILLVINIMLSASAAGLL